MDLAGKSENIVDNLIEQLTESYGDLEVSEKVWEISSEKFDEESENFRNGGYGGAGIWLTNSDGEILLVKNKGDKAWSDPGGHNEPGENFEETARRELKEETGAEARITGLISAEKIRFERKTDEEDYFYNLIAVFKGEYVGGEVRPQNNEIENVKWWSSHPDELLYDGLKEFSIPADP